MKKAVILDGYTLNPGDLSWVGLKQLVEAEVYDRTGYSTAAAPLVLERARDKELILTNKTPVTREIIEGLPKLEYIGLLSTGYDVVDVKAAAERGIVVTNIPTYGTASVSQMAMGLLLELCLHVGEHSRAVHSGDWASNADWCFWNYPMIELAEKTMGIVGYGRIGQATGRIAEAMGMKVIAYDAFHVPALEGESSPYVELEELFRQADVICLHCPLTPENKGFINANNIEKMKDGVLLINNSRGGLVNEQELAAALKSGKVAGAALDVVSSEPIREDNPLLGLDNCIITPHISWASKEARSRLMDTAVENIRCYLEGKPVNTVKL